MIWHPLCRWGNPAFRDAHAASISGSQWVRNCTCFQGLHRGGLWQPPSAHITHRCATWQRASGLGRIAPKSGRLHSCALDCGTWALIPSRGAVCNCRAPWATQHSCTSSVAVIYIRPKPQVRAHAVACGGPRTHTISSSDKKLPRAPHHREVTGAARPLWRWTWRGESKVRSAVSLARHRCDSRRVVCCACHGCHCQCACDPSPSCSSPPTPSVVSSPPSLLLALFLSPPFIPFSSLALTVTIGVDIQPASASAS